MTQRANTIDEIADGELTVLVPRADSSSGPYSSKMVFEAYSCSSAEARLLIEKFTRTGTRFQVVYPVKTTVTINIKFEE